MTRMVLEEFALRNFLQQDRVNGAICVFRQAKPVSKKAILHRFNRGEICED